MNTWIIAGIMVGLLLVGGIAFASAISTDEAETTSTSSCTSCGNQCSAESNCGLATCGATQGKTCGCGK
ncbi:MAG: hypothetical protein WC511_00340 [Candidatus Pacearchaeota archaeon]|jgi:hypothetical protein